MPFTPRSYEQIANDMLAYVQMQTNLTDFEVGSVVRTIIEAAALEDDEQYYQMVQLLDAFRLSTASGQDLDNRVADWGLIRLQPESSSVEIEVKDLALPTTILTGDTPVSSSILPVEDTSSFPTTFPFNARLGEGTPQVEEVIVTNIVGNSITIIPVSTKEHHLGDRISYVSGSADRTFNTGMRVQVPATGNARPIVFVTVERGTLVNGNFYSTPIRARCEVPGSLGNVGAEQISQFASSPPFDEAGVTNPSASGGGRDLETDAQLIDRARSAIQSLSRGTVFALKEGVLGVEDPVTGQRVTTSSILESFTDNEVILYIDDGTGFVPDSVVMASSTLSVAANPGDDHLHLDSTDGFTFSGFILLDSGNLGDAEILEYVNIDRSTNVITLAAGVTVANTHAIGAVVELVDLISAAAESGENFFNTSSYPIERGSMRLWIQPVGDPVELKIEGTDFILNRGNGQIEFYGPGLVVGTKVISTYTYFTGLIAQVQKVVDGDPTDTTNYPGIKAAGIHVSVETPEIKLIEVRATLSVKSGYSESSVTPNVSSTIESYINSLGIGEDIIVSEIIRRAMSIEGVADIRMITPTSNIVILEYELPRVDVITIT